VAAVNRAMLDQNQVIRLLTELPRVLDLDPDHAEAQALFDEARRQGRQRAEKLLDTLPDLLRRSRILTETRVREIERLDPDGAIATRARQILLGR
jgi:hypothetical protein